MQGTQGRLGSFTGVSLSVSNAASTAAAGVDDGKCGGLEQDTDYSGHDIRFVSNVTEPAACCALWCGPSDFARSLPLAPMCYAPTGHDHREGTRADVNGARSLAETACAGFSLMGAADTGKAWARRCYLKSSMLRGAHYKTHISAKIPGRSPAPAPPSPAGPPAGLPLPPHTVIALVFTVKYFPALDLFLFEQSWSAPPPRPERPHAARRSRLCCQPSRAPPAGSTNSALALSRLYTGRLGWSWPTPTARALLAVGETVILLHPPAPLEGVSIGITQGVSSK